MAAIIIIGVEKEVIELAATTPEVEVCGIMDPWPGADTLGYRNLGADRDWPEVRLKFPLAKIVITVDPPAIKEKIALIYGVESFGALVSSQAFVSHTASIGAGHIVQIGCRIFSKARIGLACKINSDAAIHHDCIIGDYCTIAPGARLLGAAKLGNRVFVGAGAIVLPKVTVGDDCTIGAGAVVVRDVPTGVTVVGVPAMDVVLRKEKCRAGSQNR